MSTDITVDSALEEAAHWFLMLRDAAVGDGDLDTLVPRFREWLVNSPENSHAFGRIREMWRELGKLDDRDRWQRGDLELPPAG